MTKSHIRTSVLAARRIWAAVHLHWRAIMAARSAEKHNPLRFNILRPDRGLGEVLRSQPPLVRRLIYGGTALATIVLIATGLLWLRLASGPLTVDIATPWVTSAIEKRFGSGHRIEVGGTQIERDEDGRTALRLRDIVVRDRDGTVVASAPKAEVGLSGANLLMGRVQASRLSLIGVEMAVRVEPDGQVNVFAGADKRPIAAAPIITAIPQAGAVTGTPAGSVALRDGAAVPTAPATLTTLLAWLDGLDALGLDGRHLTEIGLKNGSLVVDDGRNGKRWAFKNINFSLTRPKEGGVAFAISSGGTDGPWSLMATVAPRGEGRRAVEAVLRDLSPKDILLALRADDGTFESDMPLSGIVRAEIGPDGAVHMAEGRLVGGAGFIGSTSEASRILVDEAQLDLRWNAANRVLILPFELQAGGNRLSFIGQLEAPREPGGPWALSINRGLIVLGAGDRAREPPLVLDRILVRARIDPAKRRFELDQADLAGMSAGVAFSAAVDYSEADPRVIMGIASTRMSVSSFKRLWPAFVVPPLRAWVIEHFGTGTVERFEFATNAPWSTLRPGGPPVPDDGLSGEIYANTSLRPIDTLPAMRDADLVVRFRGRKATVTLGRATVELPSGRKIAVSNGLFEVLDTEGKPPPARLRMRAEGPIEAAAELADMEPLRGVADLRLDPTTTRGAVAAQFSLALPLTKNIPPGALTYNLDAEITNFSAERLVRGLNVEAPNLRVSCGTQGFQVKGDAKIGNAIVTVDYRKPKPDADAELRAQTVLDDSARTYLGLDLGGTVVGPVPVKFSGRVAAGGGDSRFAVDADLTQAKITDLLPGWAKPAGKPIRATFILIEKAQSRRIEDLLIEGSGARVKGTIEVDQSGDVVSANFPVFAPSDGDKVSIKVDRASDGTLKVTMRGDVFDGRGFIKSSASGPSDPNAKRSTYDLDLDIKVGAMVGFNGEALRSFDARLSRRAGQIRSFGLNAKLGRDAPLSGDLRARSGRPVIYIESSDAGALFRLTDMYPRMYGGQLWMAMDPPTADRAPQEGVLNIREFAVRGEAALDRVASSAPPPDATAYAPPGRNHGVEFSRMRIEFTRSPGRMVVRDGVVWGPAVGATMDGQIDFLREDVRLRGTFVPAYSLNNLAAQLPILGLFLAGGRNEGLLGVTYEVVGPPSGMVLRVNPMSAIAPGFLRKLFEFRHGDEPVVTGSGGDLAR